MIPAKHPAPLERATAGESLSHIVCCNDRYVTFCGLSTDCELDPELEEAECVVCRSLEKDPTFCPTWVRCEHG